MFKNLIIILGSVILILISINYIKQIIIEFKKSKDKRQTVSLVAFLSFYKLFKDNLKTKIKTNETLQLPKKNG